MPEIKAPPVKAKFEYSAAPQRSPEWYRLRLGRVTASRLEDWLSVSKAKATLGKPLKARLDYEKELIYERQFGVGFRTWVSDAMQDGIDFEDFARKQYEKIEGVRTDEVGCWYNDHFVASPDRAIYYSDAHRAGEVEADLGLLEVKVLYDNAFSDVLLNGVPQKHWKQIQGQLWASSAKWCDYVAINLNTKKVKIIRVFPDAEFHEWLELAVPEPLVTANFSEEGLFDFKDPIPEGGFDPLTVGSKIAGEKTAIDDRSLNTKGWAA